MGMPLPCADYIASVCTQYAVTGKCLTLGRQTFGFGAAELTSLLRSHGLLLESRGPGLLGGPTSLERFCKETGDIGKEFQDEDGNVTDAVFFAAIGFDHVDSLDVSSYEQANIQFDLNKPNLSDAVKTRYNLILDGGTLEHIFHLPNALRNVHDMLLPEGIIIHQSPTHNFVDHGFYQFCPTLFYDYYWANGYEILSISMGCEDEQIVYTPGCLQSRTGPGSMGGFDHRVWGTNAVVRKRKTSTGDVCPQQGAYMRYPNWAAMLEIGASQAVEEVTRDR
jgi:hypothetical protein